MLLLKDLGFFSMDASSVSGVNLGGDVVTGTDRKL